MPLITKTSIEVPFSFYAYHRFADAPKEVSFLREVHPHDFEVMVSIEVRHDDRELEFYLVKEYLITNILNISRYIEDKQFMCSCEQIASYIYDLLCVNYGTDRDYKIRVSEDGKSAAIKEYINE